MKTYNLIGVILITILTFGCKKSDIERYNIEDAAVHFPCGAMSPPGTTYDKETKVFNCFFSFLDSIGNTSAVIRIPVKAVGPTAPYDRVVKFTLDEEKTTALPKDYEVISSFVPAGEVIGYITIRAKYDPELQTNDRKLAINIIASDDFAKGYPDWCYGELIWNEKLIPPTATNTKRSYNHLIKGETFPTATTINYYSPKAHKLILLVLDAKDIPLYTAAPWIIYSNYTAWCAKMDKFIKQWNIDHPNDPWIHDAGRSVGLPITPRGYNY